MADIASFSHKFLKSFTEIPATLAHVFKLFVFKATSLSICVITAEIAEPPPSASNPTLERVVANAKTCCSVNPI